MSFSVFDSESILLPAFDKPYADEAFISWLTRLAFDHGLRRSTLLRKIGSDSYSIYSWDAKRSLVGKVLDTLATRTNCTTDELRNTTLFYYENKLFPKLPGAVIPPKWVVMGYKEQGRHKYYKSGTLFCPSCFSKTNRAVYYKKSWRLSISFVCLECGCYLRDHCPHCSRVAFYKNRPSDLLSHKTIDDYLLACGGCHKDISNCDPEAAPDTIVRMQRHINEYLEQGYNQTERYSVGYFNVLHHIANLLVRGKNNKNIEALTEAVFDKCEISDILQHKIHETPLQYLSVKPRAAVFSVAFWLLDEWPARFMSLCNKYRLTSCEILNYAKGLPEWFTSPVTRDFGVMKDLGNFPWRSYTYAPTLKECHNVECPESFDNNKMDYDYDPYENYFDGDGSEDIIVYNKYRNKAKYCASDIIHEQFLKAEGWA